MFHSCPFAAKVPFSCSSHYLRQKNLTPSRKAAKKLSQPLQKPLRHGAFA
jgi:hypothetical protein